MKNLFLIFPRAAGGNHVANMIKLCKEFSDERYKKDILEKYRNFKPEDNIKSEYSLYRQSHVVNAHFHNLCHIDEIWTKHHIFSFFKNNKINICTGHFKNFRKAVLTNIIDDFQDYSGLVFNIPKKDSLAFRRIVSHQKPNNIEHSYYKYPFIIGQKFVIDDSNGYNIETEKLFFDNGSDYLRKILFAKWGFILTEEADEMHSYWLKWILASVERFEARIIL